MKTPKIEDSYETDRVRRLPAHDGHGSRKVATMITGENYMRVFSTFIPRILWPSKPLYGRAQWVSAWIAGSELERDEDFTGPAIGILGATQLNGGALGTFIVLALPRTLAPHGLRVLPSPCRRSAGPSSGGRSLFTMPGSWSSATIP